MDYQTIHPVQKDILVRLMQNPVEMRFSDLLPESMKLESDRFNYHLKILVKLGFVQKNESSYKLTEKGLIFISKYTAVGGVVSTPKVSVAVFAFRENDGKREILLQNRTRHPFYGDINSIAGKVRTGESAYDTAKRKLREESGLEAELKYVGTLRKVRYNQEKEILEDTMYLYFYTDTISGELIEKNEYGENFWVPVEHAEYLMRNNYDSGEKDFKHLRRIIDGDLTLFYEEEFREVKGYTK